jgi:hypothetical protein
MDEQIQCFSLLNCDSAREVEINNNARGAWINIREYASDQGEYKSKILKNNPAILLLESFVTAIDNTIIVKMLTMTEGILKFPIDDPNKKYIGE